MYVDTPDPINQPLNYYPQYGCREAIYKKGNRIHDLGQKQRVEKDDIRLTDVIINNGNTVISYKEDTVVSAGDADVGSYLTHFGKRNRFYDIPRPSLADERKNKELKSNGGDFYNLTLDSDEEIYQTRNMYYWGEGYSYYYVDNILYCDLDNDFTCSPGDFRVADLSNRYGSGSVVGINDADRVTTQWFTLQI